MCMQPPLPLELLSTGAKLNSVRYQGRNVKSVVSVIGVWNMEGAISRRQTRRNLVGRRTQDVCDFFGSNIPLDNQGDFLRSV